jgi:hypothetical protein
MKRTLFYSLPLFFLLGFVAPTANAQVKKTEKVIKSATETVSKHFITEKEVLEVQKRWSDGVVGIGKVYQDGGNYVAAAEKHIDELYGYDLGPVLFKPTLASEVQFRTTKEGALSYFVGKNPKFAEDKGFAITPWSKVRWESTGIKTEGNMAMAMGNYYFTPAKGGDEVKVEYVFGYTKDADGHLRIILHSSHIPYQP